MTNLDVYLHSDHIGHLTRLEQARIQFTYDENWLRDPDAIPLSLSLPLRDEPFSDEECEPFFAGLLPEGDFLKAVARAFAVSAANPFALLNAIGGECAGAVSLSPAGQLLPFQSQRPPRWLSDQQLGELVARMPQRPLLAGEDGLRLSLAGTQEKIGALEENAKVGITHGRPPTNRILKAPIDRFPDTVANEAFCMRLARVADLDVAQAGPRKAADQEFLLVHRYDRTSNGEIRRIHQEDFCQALGFVPALKYQSDGGPSVRDCARLIREHAAGPAVDLLAFLDALYFNYLIGNHDAHAKNYSILLEGARAPRLAPLYDLVSTRVYEGLDKKLAMKYGAENRPDWIRGRHLDRLAADLEINPRVVRSRASALGERVTNGIGEAREHLPEPWRTASVIDSITELIGNRFDKLLAAAAEPA
jgi:serine/threonine-protein kinase HipA